MPLNHRQFEKEYYQKKSEKKILGYEESKELDDKLARRLFGWKQEASGEGEAGVYEDDYIKIEARCFPCEFKDQAIKHYISLIGFDINTHMSEWRRLDDLTVTVGGEKRSFSDILPGWQVVFNVGKQYRAQAGSDYDSRTIYLDDISTLKNLWILCHEIGHALNSEELTDEEREKLEESIDACDSTAREETPVAKEHINRVLKNERNAWAAAAKITRLLIKGNLLSKEDAHDLVHRRSDRGLGSYSLGIKRFAKKGLIAGDQ